MSLAAAIIAISRCNSIADLHGLTVAWRAVRLSFPPDVGKAMDARQGALDVD